MSLIHESLFKKTDGKEAPFSEYIQQLIPQLIEV
ncbi:MAG: two-component sensor histidine kinase [Vicingaceae bacterium]|jgi:two-component sensor histidine kinase